MITIYYKNGREKEVLELSEFRSNSWVYVENPTSDELATLVSKYGLDESLLKDAVDIHEVPRIEIEDGVIYIFTRFAFSANDQIDTSPMLIAIKKDTLITVSIQPFPRIERIIRSKDFHSYRNKILLKLFGQINDIYNDYLNNISKKLRSSSIRVEKIKNRDIIKFLDYENVLYDFNSSLVRVNSIYNSLLGGKSLKLSEEELDTVEDLSLDTGQLIQITKESLRTIVNIREAYSTVMTNNLNQVIKLFTSLTVILTIPTMIGAFYGMNVQLPFANSPFAFFGILFATLLIVVLVGIIFVHKDWL